MSSKNPKARDGVVDTAVATEGAAPAAERTPLMNLRLIYKAKAKEQGQTQLTISHADSLELKKHGGVAVDLRIGSPTKGKPHLMLSCAHKGREFSLVVGDTHSVWEQHQSNEAGRAFVKAACAALGGEQGIRLPVYEVKLVGAGEGGGAVGGDDIDIAF